jgi:hypothetical protein
MTPIRNPRFAIRDRPPASGSHLHPYGTGSYVTILFMSVSSLATSFDRLKTSIASIGESFYRTQLQLAATVLGNAIAGMDEAPTPGQVSDAEFAFNDITSMAAELSAADEEILNPAIEEFRRSLAGLKETRGLPPELVAQARSLQEKLRVRRDALERQGYRFEGEEPPQIPNHPRELCLPARKLQRELEAAGFSMAALDKLVSSPDDFVYHDVADLIADIDAAIR